ncbi:hypothetical protein [Vibrio casei]|uniref:DUF559 domain-containing protein n=1 Tax=Vibrio casei TaxID=673372 RepID=A0A368LHQ4_9VIBR|nr:hypothetical protein [Vibrio casei]RCS70155.1 hypothetical protein CIK83_11865 [Vibrio casei]SJN24321.1 phage-related hypothetical protein [Vibrio casei]
MASIGEKLFLSHINSLGLAAPESEYRFKGLCGKRRWRFDFAYPDLMLAIEIEGGVYAKGRHTRGKGYEQDCEKYNAATAMGWRVFRFTTGMVKSGEAVSVIEGLLVNQKSDKSRLIKSVMR